MDKYIGRLLDNRYEILEVIGTGGMAVVYKARCHRLNRLVAIKILKEEYSQDEEFRRRFHAESQAVAMLNHPNIVSVYDVSTSGDADYIVMELVDGMTLKQYMEKRGILNWKEALHFAMQIAKALEHAHNQGIVHRDIKPHNVMILKNGSAKVTDFGIARIMSSQNTLTKEALGSVHYISPEQAKGGRVDNRSDLYSLGVVMYEMLTGRPPYDGESPVAVALQHINGGAPMPSTINPNIPGGLEQIIMHAMSVDPVRRYASATEMLYDMEEFRKNPSILFYFDAEPQPVHDRAAVPAGVAAGTAAARRPAPRNSAERVAGVRQDVPRPRQVEPDRARQNSARMRAVPEPEEEEPRRSKGVTIAVISCAVVAVIAVVVLIVLMTKGGGGVMVEVPSFVGEVFNDIDQSKYPDLVLLDDEYVYHAEVEEGKVISQDPDAHTNVEKGTKVKLVISMGVQTGEMNDLVNRTKENAQKYLDGLTDLNLTIVMEEEFSTEIEAGRVTRTDPEAGETLQAGQTVTVWISKGPQTMTMKDLADETRANAEAYLRNLTDMNLNVQAEEEASEEIEAGRVIRTEPKAGATLTAGQTVVLYVSKGSDVVLAKVPQVIGMDISKAISILKDVNLKCDYDYVDSDKPKDQVVKQSIDKGEEVPEQTVIKLEISNGPAETQPPTNPSVSKKVTLQLPSDITATYIIAVYYQGEQITDNYEVQVGETEVKVILDGKGVQYFDFYVNGKNVTSFKVDFSNSGEDKIPLSFRVDG